MKRILGILATLVLGLALMGCIGDGTHVVGVDIQPGTYQNSDSSAGCYWERSWGSGGVFEDVIENDFTDYPTEVTIGKTDISFTSRGCGTWTLVRPAEVSPWPGPTKPEGLEVTTSVLWRAFSGHIDAVNATWAYCAGIQMSNNYTPEQVARWTEDARYQAWTELEGACGLPTDDLCEPCDNQNGAYAPDESGCNCSDFSTWIKAQACWMWVTVGYGGDADPAGIWGNPFTRDSDHNGLVCESLPGAP